MKTVQPLTIFINNGDAFGINSFWISNKAILINIICLLYAADECSWFTVDRISNSSASRLEMIWIFVLRFSNKAHRRVRTNIWQSQCTQTAWPSSPFSRKLTHTRVWANISIDSCEESHLTLLQFPRKYLVNSFDAECERWAGDAMTSIPSGHRSRSHRFGWKLIVARKEMEHYCAATDKAAASTQGMCSARRSRVLSLTEFILQNAFRRHCTPECCAAAPENSNSPGRRPRGKQKNPSRASWAQSKQRWRRDSPRSSLKSRRTQLRRWSDKSRRPEQRRNESWRTTSKETWKPSSTRWAKNEHRRKRRVCFN